VTNTEGKSAFGLNRVAILFVKLELEFLGFNSDGAKAWRSTNYGLLKVVEIAEFVNTVMATSKITCEALPSDLVSIVGKSACMLTVVVTKSINDAFIFVAQLVRLNIHYQLILVACMKCIIHAHHLRSVCT
jgi:hypothetical protein